MPTNLSIPTGSASNIALTVGAALGVGAVTAACYYHYQKRLSEKPPTNWRKIGEVTELICYPIKSLGPIRVSKIGCNQLGMEDGYLRDRVFMVVSPEGQFITARTFPKMVNIKPEVIDDRMILTAPGMIDIEFNIKNLYDQPRRVASVWQQTVESIDCGDEVAKWISTYLTDKSDDQSMRLVFYPLTKPTRSVRAKNLRYDTLTAADSGALHDASSFMLMTESSLADLNSRLDHNTTALQFRPNIVIKGPGKFEEDDYKWIKIGENTIFKNVKACSRCIFTNIDPVTAKRNPKHEPLTTLKNYRNIIPNESPIMGVHLGIRQPGQIAIGDLVYIGE